MKWIDYILDKLWLLIILGYVIAVAITVTTPAESKGTIELPQKTIYVYLGEFTVTAYCPCEICCGEWTGSQTASGAIPTSNRTVGVDWSMISPGTTIYIDEIGEYIVEDKLSEWVCERYDGMIIDIYFDTHEEATSFGKQTLKVWEVQR